MKIMIIRHGEPDYARDTLTEKGWREAEALAAYLEKIPVDAWYCSPLGRARDTASPTLKRLGKTPEIREWLHEFSWCVDDYETGGKRIIWDFLPGWYVDQPELANRDTWLSHPLMKTGPVDEGFRTVSEGLDRLLAEHGYIREGNLYRTDGGNKKTIVLFCHFGVSMVIMAYLLGMSPVAMLQGCFAAPSSVSTLVTEERVPGKAVFRLHEMGSTTHLTLAGEPVSPAGTYVETGYEEGRR